MSENDCKIIRSRGAIGSNILALEHYTGNNDTASIRLRERVSLIQYYWFLERYFSRLSVLKVEIISTSVVVVVVGSCSAVVVVVVGGCSAVVVVVVGGCSAVVVVVVVGRELSCSESVLL